MTKKKEENIKEVTLEIVELVADLNNKKGVILDDKYIFGASKLKEEYAYIWVF